MRRIEAGRQQRLAGPRKQRRDGAQRHTTHTHTHTLPSDSPQEAATGAPTRSPSFSRMMISVRSISQESNSEPYREMVVPVRDLLRFGAGYISWQMRPSGLLE